MKKLILLITLIFSTVAETKQINLEDYKQDFVIETRQIFLPDYPDAFNPSITMWNDQYLMSFRSRHPLTKKTNLTHIIHLDKKFNPVGPIYSFQIHKHPSSLGTLQDPRLVVVGESLYAVYSDEWTGSNSSLRRVFTAKVFFDGQKYFTSKPKVFLHFEGIPNQKFEKNWTPFEYNGKLLLSYSINPHKVFLPIFDEERCITVGYSETNLSWRWGELRGGTQALLIDDFYLSFFHSSISMKTTHSKGKKITHYFMGAYTFENSPPFSIKKISPSFIVGKNFYEGPAYKTWKPLRVVFPCGFVQNKNIIAVSYGRQDHEMWIITLDKKKLLNSLVPL